MRHGQRTPLRTSLTPYTRRGWSVVKGRSDIYTRPLPLYIPSEVTWFHGEIPRLWTLLTLSPFLSSYPSSSFFTLCFLSFYLPFVSFSSLLVSLLLSTLFFFYFSLLALYFIFLFRIVQFIYILLRCSLFIPFASGIVSSSWTRIMSVQPLPLLRPFCFPVYHRVTVHRAFSSSCFAKRTRPA